MQGVVRTTHSPLIAQAAVWRRLLATVAAAAAAAGGATLEEQLRRAPWLQLAQVGGG